MRFIIHELFITAGFLVPIFTEPFTNDPGGKGIFLFLWVLLTIFNITWYLTVDRTNNKHTKSQTDKE